MCEQVLYYHSIVVAIRRISKIELEIIIKLIAMRGNLNTKVDTVHTLVIAEQQMLIIMARSR